MNKGYEFDLTTNEFRMTESFARKASQVGTPEYQMILKVKRDYPLVTVKKIVKPKGGRGLNYVLFVKFCEGRIVTINAGEIRGCQVA